MDMYLNLRDLYFQYSGGNRTIFFNAGVESDQGHHLDVQDSVVINASDTAVSIHGRIVDFCEPLLEAAFSIDIPSSAKRIIFGRGCARSTDTFPTVIEVDIGSIPRYSGMFEVAGTNLVNGKQVLIQQSIDSYTGKGTLSDEAEFDLLLVSAHVEDADTIRAYWSCAPKGGPIKGNVKFSYSVSG